MARRKHYVMYGFKLDDIEKTGYFGNDLNIVQDLSAARQFKAMRSGKSGTPEQWLEFINADDCLNHGYKFHLVAVTI